ncbi:MAG: porin, partial [Hyphomicrobiales bacterium]|nr:porin [Hyphomicrobiales bacterium]
MKKYLLGTTAFAAASLVASGASAQSLEDRIRTLEEQMLMGAPGSGFDITVSGYIHGGFFLQDIDPLTAAPNEEDYGAVDVKMGGAEAQFTAQTTLDNGIDLMGRIELSGFTTSDQIDETYIRAQGGFGQVTLGADDDAWNLTHYSSPNPGLNGIDSPNYRHAVVTGARTGTNASLTGDANKITYFTPRFSGFQFGISYTP